MEQAKPVKNPALKKAIKDARKEPNEENSVRLLNEVVKARLLIPVSMDKDPEYDEKLKEVVLEKDTRISFELIKAKNGELYYPVFTDGEEMLKCDIEKDQHSMIVNFDDLAAILLMPQSGIAGFSINPMSDNLCFRTEMVAAMKRDMEKERKERAESEECDNNDVACIRSLCPVSNSHRLYIGSLGERGGIHNREGIRSR